MIRTCVTFGWVVLIAAVPVVSAQTFEQRLEHVRQQRERERQRIIEESVVVAAPVERTVHQKLAAVIEDVDFEEITVRQALDWWSDATEIPLVIEWAGMELDGVDPETPVTLKLQRVPATQLLQMLMTLAAADVPMLYEATPWYVQIMTKTQANKHRVTRIYEIDDLLVHVPNFKGPEFDLENALDSSADRGRGGSSSGGSGVGAGGGGRGGSLFRDDEDDKEVVVSKEERGQQIIDLIQQTVEPEVWQFNGGESSIRYFQGKLVVNAPNYVHRQIGLPMKSSRAEPGAAPARSRRSNPAVAPRHQTPETYYPARRPGVSGVLPE